MALSHLAAGLAGAVVGAALLATAADPIARGAADALALERVRATLALTREERDAARFLAAAAEAELDDARRSAADANLRATRTENEAAWWRVQALHAEGRLSSAEYELANLRDRVRPCLCP